MKEMEERVYSVLNDKIDNCNRRLSDGLFKNQNSTISHQLSLSKERQRVVESTSSLLSAGNPNMKKMESALNDWLERVEE